MSAPFQRSLEPCTLQAKVGAANTRAAKREHVCGLVVGTRKFRGENLDRQKEESESIKDWHQNLCSTDSACRIDTPRALTHSLDDCT